MSNSCPEKLHCWSYTLGDKRHRCVSCCVCGEEAWTRAGFKRDEKRLCTCGHPFTQHDSRNVGAKKIRRWGDYDCFARPERYYPVNPCRCLAFKESS